MTCHSARFCLFLLLSSLFACPSRVEASGPRWTAGVNYFDPAAKGQPVVWAGGRVSYYVDQGALSASVSNSQAAALVAGAAAVWSAVPTAAVMITQGGSLAEDVSGSNVAANAPAGSGATLPADTQPTATMQPVAIIFDLDGTVIDDLYGPTASDPADCDETGVYSTVDAFSTAGNLAHALIVVNGRCATSSGLNTLLQYELVRAFGRVLGLDWSQVNESMWPNPTQDGLAGWPLMHPSERLCTRSMTTCLPNQMVLRPDDSAGLAALYPVTSANIGAWSGKTITAATTITVQGTVTFRNGQGMQGVNVVLTVLTPTANGNEADLRYTVSAVSGARYQTNTGNAVTGATDGQGNALGRFGSDAAAQEGHFVFGGVPLPAGQTSAMYELSIEPVNVLYTGSSAVGPYAANQVMPSGAMQRVLLGSLGEGSAVTQNFILADSADGVLTDDGVEAQPNSAGGTGEWLAKLVGYGHTGWFQFHARANRTFTVEAESLSENGASTENKSAVLIGIWNGSDAMGSSPAMASTVPFNGAITGLSTLSASTNSDGEVRVAYADMRGDGRPDFTYRARVLYADSVFPPRLTLAGGTIVIHGQGFSPVTTVLVGGVPAAVTSVSPTEITAVAPPVNVATGTVVLTVRDSQTQGTAAILDGLSYDAEGTDGIRITSAPQGTVSVGVPVSLVVQVVAGDGKTPAANVTVMFTLAKGAAAMSCGSSPCVAVTNGNGTANIMVVPASTQATQIVASLTNGSNQTAEFDGGMAPLIAATNTLYLAIGAQINWSPVAIVLSGGTPVQGANIQWSAGTGVQMAAAAVSTSNAAGLATTIVTVNPLSAGATAKVMACEVSPGQCATFTVNAVHAELAQLLPVSGVGQSLPASGTAMPVTIEVVDGAGHPLAGATVNVYQQLDAWQPPCPATGRCPAVMELGTTASTLTSDVNGLVMPTLMLSSGQPTVLHVLVTTGQSGTMSFSVTQHP